MKRSTIAIIGLTIALIGSNVYWFLQVLDVGIRSTYLKASFDAQSIALKEALAVLPVAADPKSSKDAVVNVGAAVYSKHQPEISGGFVRLYGVSLKFNEQGRLIEAEENYRSGTEFLPRASNQ